jgi:ATP-dependent Clp protease ATP-binding subunit ClpC
MLSDVRERLRYQDIDIKVSEEAKAFILEKGYNPRYGARPLRRKIQQLIEDRMADMLLEGKIKKGSLVSIDEDKGEMTFECTKPQKRKKEKKAAV